MTDPGSLTVRRTIRASATRAFEAWTEPRHLLAWWGPAGVTCVGAEVELRVGGVWRVGNRIPDGNEVWIEGLFEVVEPPTRLVYSWRMGTGPDAERSLVTVDFVALEADRCEVVVHHTRIPDAPTRDSHLAGWNGCLDGLRDYYAS